MERLAKVPHVQAVAPGLYGQVLISRGARSGGALIKGIFPADERKVGELLKNLPDSTLYDLSPIEGRLCSGQIDTGAVCGTNPDGSRSWEPTNPIPPSSSATNWLSRSAQRSATQSS